MLKSVAMFLLLLLLITIPIIVFSSSNGNSVQEIPSPGNWVTEEQIKVYQNRILLEVYNSTWATFTNTNSMDPLLDEQANVIQIKPQNPGALNVGDVISYETDQGIVIHRIIAQGNDEEGAYFTVKGDNNKLHDPIKVRFTQITGVVIAVIY